MAYTSWQLREQKRLGWFGPQLSHFYRAHGVPASSVAGPGPPPRYPATWHGDPGEGLGLAQRVHLDVPERLAHGALQVPATQGAARELLGPHPSQPSSGLRALVQRWGRGPGGTAWLLPPPEQPSLKELSGFLSLGSSFETGATLASAPRFRAQQSTFRGSSSSLRNATSKWIEAQPSE